MIITEMLADPKNKQIMRDAVVDMLPAAISGQLSQAIYNLNLTVTNDVIGRIREMKSNGTPL